MKLNFSWLVLPLSDLMDGRCRKTFKKLSLFASKIYLFIYLYYKILLLFLLFQRETSQLLEKGTRFLKACYRKEMQDIANLIIYSVKSTMRMFCRKRSKKLDALLAATPCFNRHLRPDDGCIMQFVNETKQLIPIKQHNLKIPHTCW